MERFEFTEDHLKLLRQMSVGWQEYCDGEYSGAPEIDPKRPYGNSGMTQIATDVAETLGWEPECRNDHDGERWFSEKQIEAALKVHRQTEIALQLYLQFGEIGAYVRGAAWEEWRKA